MNCANESFMTSKSQKPDEHVSVKTLTELIRRYESIVYDYLAIMNSSETLKSMDVAKYTVQLGLNSITHIYKLAFCITKNVGISADHCQKGIYCFIEYIEQTYKLGYVNGSSIGGSHQFDFMDAILFIYDKTISELRNDNSSSLDERTGSSAFTNILSVSQSHQAYGDDFVECKSALENFGRVVSILLWIGHPTMTLTDQMDIVDNHLIEFLDWYSSKSLDSGHSFEKRIDKDLFLFLETVQETIKGMDKKEYMDFLVSMKKQMKKQDKKGVDTMSVLPACLYLKTLSGMTLKEIGEQEKWKRGADDLAKLAFHCS